MGMNCAEVMSKFVAEIEGSRLGEFVSLRKVWEADEWSGHYAYVIMELIEDGEPYRDYDRIAEDALDVLRKLVSSRTQVWWSTHDSKNNPCPKKGSLLSIYPKSGGLSFELFLYNATILEKKSQAEKARMAKKKAAKMPKVNSRSSAMVS